MSNDKQSSVEWYIEKIRDLDYEYAKGLITLGVWSERKNALIKQAKAMHKEEVTSFTADWSIQWKYEDGKSINEYYNEVYGCNNDQQ